MAMEPSSAKEHPDGDVGSGDENLDLPEHLQALMQQLRRPLSPSELEYINRPIEAGDSSVGAPSPDPIAEPSVIHEPLLPAVEPPAWLKPVAGGTRAAIDFSADPETRRKQMLMDYKLVEVGRKREATSTTATGTRLEYYGYDYEDRYHPARQRVEAAPTKARLLMEHARMGQIMDLYASGGRPLTLAEVLRQHETEAQTHNSMQDLKRFSKRKTHMVYGSPQRPMRAGSLPDLRPQPELRSVGTQVFTGDLGDDVEFAPPPFSVMIAPKPQPSRPEPAGLVAPYKVYKPKQARRRRTGRAGRRGQKKRRKKLRSSVSLPSIIAPPSLPQTIATVQSAAWKADQLRSLMTGSPPRLPHDLSRPVATATRGTQTDLDLAVTTIGSIGIGRDVVLE